MKYGSSRCLMTDLATEQRGRKLACKNRIFSLAIGSQAREGLYTFV